ncbi:N-6 DNA methylase [Methylobacter luteus]|uniref:N-6 DNA methylase n=1 Tax=Methylobacter luteus TaxID=415 RepID=UPI000561425F|nr:N-6 DNA methylase [Methylobacter luteus]
MNLELSMDTEIHEVYRRIRNYLAGRVIGITRDKSLLHEVVKCLFCHVRLIESNCLNSISEAEDVAKCYRNAFSQLKNELDHIFSNDEEILLDPTSINYVHQALSLLDLSNPQKDPLGELYQAFIGSDLRMAEGQFFTPHQAIEWIVEAIAPQSGEKIIDPACGPGGFLSYAARYLLSNGIDRQEINSCLFGIEKDEYLSKLANAHIALATLRKANIFCADSIEKKDLQGKPLSLELEGQYDIVLANPPFGAKIKTGSDATRKQFDLAYTWKIDKKTGKITKTGVLQKNTPPQILFIELCLKLLKPGGRMGIVVPESMISNSSTSHVVQYIRENADISAVCGMPESLFKTSGKGGTHTKTCLLIAHKKQKDVKNQNIFMAEVKWCGHDSRGNKIPYNDLPTTLSNYKSKIEKEDYDHLGYYISEASIAENILAPRYYNPEPLKKLKILEKTHDIVSIESLVKDGVISFSTGDEVGKLAYGTGTIPFVRTSDLSNWELKLDPKHGVSNEIYSSLSKKQDVKEGDILMVKDGTYLIGSCAYVSKYDEKMVYQSHLYKIRVHRKDIMSPFLLLALLSSEPVIQQIKSKRFTQDIIDSLGKRVNELLLPIPKSKDLRNKIERMVQQSVEDRIEARELARKAKIEVVM